MDGRIMEQLDQEAADRAKNVQALHARIATLEAEAAAMQEVLDGVADDLWELRRGTSHTEKGSELFWANYDRAIRAHMALVRCKMDGAGLELQRRLERAEARVGGECPHAHAFRCEVCSGSGYVDDEGAIGGNSECRNCLGGTVVEGHPLPEQQGESV